MYDVIVIGGGHAGVEAACAAARRGATVALLTFRRDDIGRMSCNPSIGGVGKGHLVREVDALGGVMAKPADRAAIHRRMLNASKGPAVRGPRVQADRRRFAAAVQNSMADHGVRIVEGEAIALVVTGGRVGGVRIADDAVLEGRSIVLATGTFLGATLYRGEEVWRGGRIGGDASIPLVSQLEDLGLAADRLKTGTPPRLDGRTIDWARLTPQPSDAAEWTLSIEPNDAPLPQLACSITRTNQRAHDIVRAGLGRSPLFGGAIQGRGPRYCPSIEDKITRFADRDSHQIFLEPEGLDDVTVYPNGVSTSLPADVQLAMMRAIEGLERVEVLEYGYAVEYRHADPRQLGSDLGHRHVAGLFFAGQINGTTGYEEAAAQGLLAGANAAAFARDLRPLCVDRAQSYLGVMVDDLTLQGVSEPYRMLTARAEHRLWLRADNAVTRLATEAVACGLLDESRAACVVAHREAKHRAKAALDRPCSPTDFGLPAGAGAPLRAWARRADLTATIRQRFASSSSSLEAFEDALYEPYVERQAAEIRIRASAAGIGIGPAFQFANVPGLSAEMSERLSAAGPETLDQASRITGVTPAALAALHFALAKAAA